MFLPYLPNRSMWSSGLLLNLSMWFSGLLLNRSMWSSGFLLNLSMWSDAEPLLLNLNMWSEKNQYCYGISPTEYETPLSTKGCWIIAIGSCPMILQRVHSTHLQVFCWIWACGPRGFYWTSTCGHLRSDSSFRTAFPSSYRTWVELTRTIVLLSILLWFILIIQTAAVIMTAVKMTISYSDS